MPLLPLFAKVPEACQALRIGKTKLYEYIEAGRLDCRKNGRRTVITVASIEELAKSLPAKTSPSGGEPRIRAGAAPAHI
jgi:hypothetical protein